MGILLVGPERASRNFQSFAQKNTSAQNPGRSPYRVLPKSTSYYLPRRNSRILKKFETPQFQNVHNNPPQEV